MKFAEYKQFSLPQVNSDILKFWKENKIFHKSLKQRENNQPFVFYEGPPSANGKPGIHHVLSRTIKDLFCRFKTMEGYYVERKAGWDTHGLPVELQVEKILGVNRYEIGEKISIEEYNKQCKKTVMQYKAEWERITEIMGYWIDLEHPYITYDPKYMESLWWALKQLYDKGLLYKGYSIQPFSPAAGTALSSHELNLPGCYRDVKDVTGVAMFKVIRDDKSEFLFKDVDTDVYILAWTTTPWTLLSNTALAVGPEITYQKIRTFNPYTGEPITVILAKDLVPNYFKPEGKDAPLQYKPGDKILPWRVLDEFKGKDLLGVRYEQLLPYQQPAEGDAFKVITGDFVSTEEGTGIVHIAPSFGADDMRVAKQHGIGSLTLVNERGKFIDGVGEFSGRFVRPEYEPDYDREIEQLQQKLDRGEINQKQFEKEAEKIADKYNVNIDIVVKLKKEGKLFKTEKHVHSYPHCWRTDKPILYYPIEAWFIKTSENKERMVALNQTINWQPPATGYGRFGEWLKNLVDWNLSRTRFWGTPLNVWMTEDKKEMKVIGSYQQLIDEINKAVKAGVMDKNPYPDFVPGDMSDENYENIDIHRPYVDRIVLVSDSGKPMHWEPFTIDVWFDSGAMPFAQFHYPFENQEKFRKYFPADFIAEGVDQTRGWFYTLHALAVMLFDSVAYKNVVSNGLVLDARGEKMSKHKGNVIDPFWAIEKYGADSIRWYMMSVSPPWENLKFDIKGVEEVIRKFFGTLYNTYNFFALYANIDGFKYAEDDIPYNERPEFDRWILSLLNSLIIKVKESLDNYDPTRAARAIQKFVIDDLSNWYVRLNRKRYWGGGYNKDKISAYQTLYQALETVAILMAPIAPFYAERIYLDLNSVTQRRQAQSVHLLDFPVADESQIDRDLEEKMAIAQKLSSMVLSLRRQAKIKVRQPLAKILIPVIDEKIEQQVAAVKDIILSEVNVKDIEFIKDTSGVVVKKIKPDYKVLGKKLGKLMKPVAQALSNMTQEEITQFEQQGRWTLDIDGTQVELTLDQVEIITEDMPGWLVKTEDKYTVALDITITEDLRQEGIARELVNRIQNLRKELDLNLTDRIKIYVQNKDFIAKAVENFAGYIKSQTLANEIVLVDRPIDGLFKKDTDVYDEPVFIQIEKI